MVTLNTKMIQHYKKMIAQLIRSGHYRGTIAKGKTFWVSEKSEAVLNRDFLVSRLLKNLRISLPITSGKHEGTCARVICTNYHDETDASAWFKEFMIELPCGEKPFGNKSFSIDSPHSVASTASVFDQIPDCSNTTELVRDLEQLGVDFKVARAANLITKDLSLDDEEDNPWTTVCFATTAS